MTKPDNNNEKIIAAKIENDEMGKYGITRVPVDYFHVGPYRYTNLADAIAQAKRRLLNDAPIAVK